MTNNPAPLPADAIEPTIDWLIDQIAPNEDHSPLLDFNKERLKKLIQQALEDAERRGRIASIDEYLHKCGTLRVEPTRRSLELFQQGQHTALAMLKLQPNMEGKDNE